ncbi:MAG: RnfABCDGE type electron transport complex subunit B [Planctomycetota bacterium]
MDGSTNILVSAIVVLGGLGLLFGVVLAVAARFFQVAVDERVEKITAALPGANCGGCGLPGCAGYADAIVNQGMALNLCAPGGATSAQKIGAIMGVAVTAGVRKFPAVHCQGAQAVRAFAYDGIATCGAAVLVQGGFKVCTWACLGLGDCGRVCPTGAIKTATGIAAVDETRCISCGKCAAACPRSLIVMRPIDRPVHVRCSNRWKGREAKTGCPMACIACRKCEKTCAFDAIHVVDNLAIVDYAKCTSCAKCVEACPQKCIVNMALERAARAEAQTEPKKETESVVV